MRFGRTEKIVLAGVFLCAFCLAIVPGDLRLRLVFALGVAIGATLAVAAVLHVRRRRSGAAPEQDSAAAEAATEPAAAEAAPAAVDLSDELLADLPELPEFPASTIDMDALATALADSDSPIDLLKMVVGSIRTREAVYAQVDDGLLDLPDTDDILPPPSDTERTFARWLEEAGLFSADGEDELPAIDVIMPERSGQYFLRARARQMPWRSHVRIIAIESALNRIMLAHDFGADEYRATEAELYRASQTAASHMACQLGEGAHAEPRTSDDPILAAVEEGPADGEWALRAAIAEQLEAWRLPMRLTADFRMNAADGQIAFELRLPPIDAFPRSRYSDAVGRVIPTTKQMRRQDQTAFALRAALLLAGAAFRASEGFRTACVSAVYETPATRRCLLSVEFERTAFAQAEDEGFEGWPEAVYERMGIELDCPDGVLAPCEQRFMLEDERFCPPRRYERPELSARELASDAAEALGARSLSGLSVDEGAPREDVVERIMRELGESSADKVRAILDMVEDQDDPRIRAQAQRVVDKIIAGTLDDDSPWGIRAEFVEGDDIADALAASVARFSAQDLPGAIAALEPALLAAESAGDYADADGVEWRSFRNYAERVLYNRMFALEGAEVRLVPASYYAALVVLGDACLLSGRVDDALRWASRALELNPFDERIRMRVIHCLEASGEHEAAAEQLRRQISFAYTPETAGFAYFRLAFQMLQAGDMRLAEACWRKSLEFASGVVPMVVIELGGLAGGGMLSGDGAMDAIAVDMALDEAGIELFPADEVAAGIAEGTRAALDAEIFPVARALGHFLAKMSPDDVIHDVIRSMEGEPDR